MTTFLNAPAGAPADLGPGAIALLGVSNATPYEAGRPSHSANAPAAMRAASAKVGAWLDHFDFDTGHELGGLGPAVLHDLGDLVGDPWAPADNRAAIRQTVAAILDRGAVPVVLGGDDSVTIPVLHAYQGHGPLWVVQVDAHIDWRDERFGEPMGWSSPMRRASEMAWVDGIVQLGIRGVGSASRGDVEDARRWGAHIVTAREVFAAGVAPCLAPIPENARRRLARLRRARPGGPAGGGAGARRPHLLAYRRHVGGIGAPHPGGRFQHRRTGAGARQRQYLGADRRPLRHERRRRD